VKHSVKTGLSFGLTSAIITTLGLMVGLYSGTNSKIAVLGAVITIALADSMSDALGIHVSEESENKHSCGLIWEATFTTFFSKGITTATFAVPVILFELKKAILINLCWGFLLLGIFSVYLAKIQNIKKSRVLIEHFLIAGIVIISTYYVGLWVFKIFSGATQ